MKKIAIVISKGEIGGAQKHVELLLDYACRHHLHRNLVLISGTTGTLIRKANDRGIRTHLVKGMDSVFRWGAAFRLYKILKFESPEIVHSHSTTATFYSRIASLLIPSSLLIYTVHGWHFAADQGVIRWLKIVMERFGKYLNQHWIFVSKFDLGLSRKHSLHRNNAYSVIYNGVPTVDKKIDYSTSDTLNVAFVGRVSRQKNCGAALDIIELCNHRIRLTMFVSGLDVESMSEAVSSRRLSDRIELVINCVDVNNELNKFDALLMTSLYEGAPLAILEAMSAGLPVISSNVCGISELVKNGKTGFLYNINCLSEAVSYLELLAQDSNLRRRLGEKAREVHIGRFTAEKMAQSTFSLYQRLVS